jgi:hypothetical protein
MMATWAILRDSTLFIGSDSSSCLQSTTTSGRTGSFNFGVGVDVMRNTDHLLVKMIVSLAVSIRYRTHRESWKAFLKGE